MTQQEIYNRVKSTIPETLWDRYIHLSFGDMAELAELSDYSEMLAEAERDWFEAEDA